MKKLFTLFLFLVVVAFTSNAQTNCNPATISNVEHEGSGNRITWSMPASGEIITISQQNGSLYDCVGAPEDMGAYHRFTPEDLAAINGDKLSQVVFIPAYAKAFQTEPGHTYIVQIFQGGVWGALEERNPGALISFQELSNENLLFHEENTITLEAPITIDASQELWIGFFCTNIEVIQSQYKGVVGVDAGPCTEGLGNIVFYRNQWRTIYEVGGSTWKNNNWCIKAKVQTVEGESVNIYFNGDKIESNIAGTTFFHSNPTGEEHCYQVEVNCKEGVVSQMSNEMCTTVGINENGEVARFTLYPNPASGALTIEWTSGQVDKWTSGQVYEIEIYDIYGRKLHSFTRSLVHSSTTSIDVSNLSAGVYFVRVMDEKGYSVQRFVKE